MPIYSTLCHVICDKKVLLIRLQDCLVGQVERSRMENAYKRKPGAGVYLGSLWRIETEGILLWIDLDQIPYDEIWEDNQYWLPLLLEKLFKGEFYFNKEGSKLLDYNIK